MTITVDIRSPIVRTTEQAKLYNYFVTFRWTDHFYCSSLQLFFNYNVLLHTQTNVGPNLTFPCLADHGKKAILPCE